MDNKQYLKYKYTRQFDVLIFRYIYLVFFLFFSIFY